MENNFIIFAGRANKILASIIVKKMGIEMGKHTLQLFSDGEFQPGYDENIRGKIVFIIQSTHQPSDNLMELLLMIDAAKRASAYKIVAIIPYFGFARQDRKDRPRVPIGAKLVSDLLQVAGASSIITMDLHADQISGFFNIPVDHLYASAVFVPKILEMQIEDLVICSPDLGGTKRANTYAKFLKVPMAVGYKDREKVNTVSKMEVIGQIEGKNVIILDDMIDTAGTLIKVVDIIMKKGAKSVRAFATHAVLSGSALEIIEKSALIEVFVTDSIPLKQTLNKITVLSIADLLAEVILRISYNKSIGSLFLAK
jgi:ribose-phosphate pyrophosphokinase